MSLEPCSLSPWIQTFSGRGDLPMNVSFLWRHENFYIMDNHLAAVWCWIQHRCSLETHSVLHIDAHFDTNVATQSIAVASANLRSLRTLSFAEYQALHIDSSDGPTQVFRWDNYLTIYQKLVSSLINEWIFSTHNLGIPPNFKVKNVPPVELLGFLCQLPAKGKNWILNLDLDFFRSSGGDRFPAQQRRAVFEKIRDLNETSKSSVVTIALSPECCGSWESAEELCYEACSVFDLPFRLPDV
jgi:hypothetical protein